MSKANQTLSNSVKKILKANKTTIKTYQEIESKIDFYFKDNFLNVIEKMKTQRAFHSIDLNMIFLDDNYLTTTEEANELVLHELIHLTAPVFNRISKTDQEKETEECIAQIGMFKIILTLNLNPSVYADKTFDYIKNFQKADYKKVELESDKAVEYLIKKINYQKVA